MEGKVKWFSDEKGYGYITDLENNDLYFGIKDIIGANLPENGDIVEYEEYFGREKTLAATKIRIKEKKHPEIKKIHCPSCQKNVIPRLWHYGGSDYTNIKTQHLCPHCGYSLFQTGGGFNIYSKIILLVFSFIMFAVIYKIWL